MYGKQQNHISSSESDDEDEEESESLDQTPVTGATIGPEDYVDFQVKHIPVQTQFIPVKPCFCGGIFCQANDFILYELIIVSTGMYILYKILWSGGGGGCVNDEQGKYIGLEKKIKKWGRKGKIRQKGEEPPPPKWGGCRYTRIEH